MNPTLSRRNFIQHTSWALGLPFISTFICTEGLHSSESVHEFQDYHLTAHPWVPLNTAKTELLTIIEGVCRFSVQHQNDEGAIIDPFLKREHQYATPYFAHAVGTLLHAGQALDLLDAGIKAMNHATLAVEGGNLAIPDRHGEFFIAPLARAIALFTGLVDDASLARWQERMSHPVEHIIESIQKKTNNWRTYAMKGEWVRVVHHLAQREDAIAFIEDAWLTRTQRERIALDKHHLYQDWNGHPQSHAVEAVGRGNLLAMIEAGYDGPSAEQIQQFVESGTELSLRLQDPTGQCPPNGRTDNHVFNDVLYQLIFDVMAERSLREGYPEKAGAYRRAANLAFQSIMRWRRAEEPWAGSFYITKNHFDPRDRTGYQPASQYSNYSGAVMYHLAEAYHARSEPIEEHPAPAEIGGYVFSMDERFGSVVANAGGMHVFANLRGDSVPKYEKFWTPLGVMRFSRVNWDSRLGPSDGARDYLFEEGVSFGPTWKVGSEWVRLAMAGEHYQGTLRVDFKHPLLVKFSILYAPVTGVGGPNFFHDFIVTPDGVMSSLHSPHTFRFGLTVPLLEDDGRLLDITVQDRIATTRYPDALSNGDEQHFIAANQEAVLLEEGESVLSTYGWLRPVRVTSEADAIHMFTYPRTPSDPTAVEVQQSIEWSDNGFSSVLGRVEGTLYTGTYAAGGVGQSLSLNDQGTPDIEFDRACGFIIRHDSGTITAVETDADVRARVQGKELNMSAFVKKAV